MRRLLILVLALLSFAPAWATTYYVGPTEAQGALGCRFNGDGKSNSCATVLGGPGRFNDLHECDTKMVAGDTCRIRPGNYYRAWATAVPTPPGGRDKSPTFYPTNSGTSLLPITYQAYDPNNFLNRPVICSTPGCSTNPANFTNAAIGTYGSDYIVFDGLRIIGSMGFGAGSNSDHLTVKNIEISGGWVWGNTFMPPPVDPDHNWAGIRTEDVTNSLFSNIYIHDITTTTQDDSTGDKGFGVVAYKTDNNVFEYMTIYRTRYAGFLLKDSCNGNTIRFSKFIDNGFYSAEGAIQGSNQNAGGGNTIHHNIMACNNSLNGDRGAGYFIPNSMPDGVESFYSNTVWGCGAGFGALTMSSTLQVLANNNYIEISTAHPYANINFCQDGACASQSFTGLDYNVYRYNNWRHGSLFTTFGPSGTAGTWRNHWSTSGTPTYESHSQILDCQLVSPGITLASDFHIQNASCKTASSTAAPVGAYGSDYACLGYGCPPIISGGPTVTIDAPTGNTTITRRQGVAFAANGSSVEGLVPITYAWDFGSGSGIPDVAVEDPGTKYFDNVGAFVVTVTGKDTDDKETSSSVTITVLPDSTDLAPSYGAAVTPTEGGACSQNYLSLLQSKVNGKTYRCTDIGGGVWQWVVIDEAGDIQKVGDCTTDDCFQTAGPHYALMGAATGTAPAIATMRAIVDLDVPNNITIDLAAAATALAANGGNCSAGSYARGVDASGAAENCTASFTTGDETDPGVPLPALSDLGDLCAALQSTRRNSGDSANECYTPTSGTTTGTGTTNALPKFTGATAIGDSALSEGASTMTATKMLILDHAGIGNQLRLRNGAYDATFLGTNTGSLDFGPSVPTLAAGGGTNLYGDLAVGGLIYLGGVVDMQTHKIINLDTPTAGTDGANKQYVDDEIDDISFPTNAATVTTVDAAGDTTTFPLLGGSATGSLGPLTDAGLSFNAATNALTAGAFIGPLTGNSSTTTALAANGGNCSAGSFPLGVDASGASESCATVASLVPGAETDAGHDNFSELAGTVSDAQVPNTITIDLSAAATALAANPTDCSSNQFANAIAASGNLTCAALVDADIPNTITVDLAAAATALAANPTDCSANQFATTIAASGNLSCSAIVDADVPNSITIDLATLATTATTANAGDSGTAFFSSGSVEVAVGGTGATTATAARVNLGVGIGGDSTMKCWTAYASSFNPVEASTSYYYFGLNLPSSNTGNVTEANRDTWPAPTSLTFHTMRVDVDTSIAAGSWTITMRKNSGATSITCPITTSTTCTDSTHSFTVAAGDVLDIEVIGASVTTTGEMRVSLCSAP